MEEALILKRATRRHMLARIENLIKQTPSYHVESSDLKAAGIRHLPLSLEGGSQHLPRFFKPYQEELPLPQKEEEAKLLEFEPDPDHIMWDTRDMQLFLTRQLHDCWAYASEEYPNNPPPSGAYREYVNFHSYFVLPADRS